MTASSVRRGDERGRGSGCPTHRQLKPTRAVGHTSPTSPPLVFVGSSLEDIRNFPADARRAAGFELSFVQQGLMPSDWKPIKEVGPGATEIRVHVLGEWRVIYVAKFTDGVYVLHAFEKKTRKTRREDIELARKRYMEVRR